MKADSCSQALGVGHWVALTLPEGVAPLRSYVGQVQATDEYGVRITLVQWLTGTATGYDLFVPWEHIQSALVATPEHDIEGFAESAGRWQSALNKKQQDQ